METAAEHETDEGRLVFFISLPEIGKEGERGIIIVRCPQRQGAMLCGWSEDSLTRLGDPHQNILVAICIQKMYPLAQQ